MNNNNLINRFNDKNNIQKTNNLLRQSKIETNPIDYIKI